MAASGVWDDLTTTETVLRDLAEELLREAHDDDWLAKSGLTEERIEKLHEGRDEERRRREGGKVSERLIHYAQFWDLETIFVKNWELFKDCFGDQKELRFHLRRLGTYRNPEAHSRDLLPFEEHLVMGITGEIRNKVTIFRSSRQDEPEHFPRIESAKDSFGNVPSGDVGDLSVDTDLTLRPGDRVTFDLRAWDPHGRSWTWTVAYDLQGHSGFEIEGDRIVWNVGEEHIRERAQLIIFLVGSGPYHRHGTVDDRVSFWYRVLPRRSA